MDFKGMNLSPRMIEALRGLGYKDASPVQSRAIPAALRGESLLVQSATGTGKTHSFLIPLVERTDLSLPRLQSVVIAPTAELARQTYEFAREFQRYFPSFKPRLYTAEDEVSQNVEGKEVPPHMAIGTPGRLKDILLSRSLFSLRNVRYLVLDEADMLLDMNFMGEVEALGKALPPKCSFLVFSATLRQNLRDALSKFVREDFRYEAEETRTASGVRHHAVDIGHMGAMNALLQLLRIKNPYLALVFCSTREEASSLHRFLHENGEEALLYSGAMERRERNRALRRIREDKERTIVATDLLARGMDIENVTDVFSLSFPQDPDFYFHRAGRTGRFGKEGDSWLLYNADTTKGPLRLLEEGVPLIYHTLRNGVLKDGKGTDLKPRKASRKKELPEEERKEILIAKAMTRRKRVEPMHRKKTQIAIERVKRKYRRKAIKEAVRGELDKKFRKGGK